MNPNAQTEFSEWHKTVSKWINRLHFRSHWRNYIENDDYAAYKEYCFVTVNSIRAVILNEPYTVEKFDEAWQYRTLTHEKYSVVLDELINVIFGWW